MQQRAPRCRNRRPKYRLAVNYNENERKFIRKKSEKNRNVTFYMRFTDQDAILCHRTTVFVANEFDPPNHNNKRPRLRGNGFTEAK